MAKQKRNEGSVLRTLVHKYANFGSIDIWLLIAVLTLLCAGLIMLFSASYPYAMTYKGSATYFIKSQTVFAVLGVVVMMIFSHIKAEFWRSMTKVVAGISTFFLILVLLLPPDEKGFRRILRISGHALFQPSEITKFAVILVGAYIFTKYAKKMRTSKPSASFLGKFVNKKLGAGIVRESWDPAWQYCFFFGMSAILVFLENHLSGFILIFMLGVVMMFVGGVRGRWFAAGLALVSVAALIICLPIASDAKKVQQARVEKAAAEAAGEEYDMSKYENISTNGSGILQGYQRERIYCWFDKDYSPTDARWQTNQAVYAIGSGGFFGKGLGNSTQKYMYVSEPQNDMIFSIVCEELGFFGAALIIGLFVFIVFRGVVIGLNASTRFGKLIALGIVFQVGLQVVLNIAVASDAMPNTGISLPFFSAGGSSLCMLLGEMGIVLSVSRDSRTKKKQGVI